MFECLSIIEEAILKAESYIVSKELSPTYIHSFERILATIFLSFLPTAKLNVEPVELLHGEDHTEDVDHDPEEVEDVVPVGALHQRTGRLGDMIICVGCKGSTKGR